MEVTQYVHAGRWRGIFGHKNGLGFWASFAAVLLFSYRNLVTGALRPLIWLGWIGGVLCLIFSESSTSIVMALSLVLASIFINMLRRTTFAVVFMIFFLTASIGGIVIYFGSDLLLGLLNRDATFTGRSYLWQAALDFIEQRPFLGYGYQALGGPDFAHFTENVFGEILGPENGYLALLLDLGIVGFVFYMVPLILGMRNAILWIPHLEKDERSALEVLFLMSVGVAVQSFTDATAILATGFDGVIAFAAYFMFMAMQKSPLDVARSEQKLARSWVKRRERIMAREGAGRRFSKP